MQFRNGYGPSARCPPNEQAPNRRRRIAPAPNRTQPKPNLLVQLQLQPPAQNVTRRIVAFRSDYPYFLFPHHSLQKTAAAGAASNLAICICC